MRENPAILAPDPARELRSFAVAQTVSMGTKRGRGRGAFIDSMIDAVDAFYENVVQNIKAWSAAPPKFREEVEPPREVRPSLSSTALSSQDGAAQAPTAPSTAAGEGQAGDESCTEEAGSLLDPLAAAAIALEPTADPADNASSTPTAVQNDPTPFAPTWTYAAPAQEDS